MKGWTEMVWSARKVMSGDSPSSIPLVNKETWVSLLREGSVGCEREEIRKREREEQRERGDKEEGE